MTIPLSALIEPPPGILLKACDRCGGDMLRDVHNDLVCLQCSNTWYVPQRRYGKRVAA